MRWSSYPRTPARGARKAPVAALVGGPQGMQLLGSSPGTVWFLSSLTMPSKLVTRLWAPRTADATWLKGLARAEGGVARWAGAEHREEGRAVGDAKRDVSSDLHVS